MSDRTIEALADALEAMAWELTESYRRLDERKHLTERQEDGMLRRRRQISAAAAALDAAGRSSAYDLQRAIQPRPKSYLTPFIVRAHR